MAWITGIAKFLLKANCWVMFIDACNINKPQHDGIARYAWVKSTEISTDVVCIFSDTGYVNQRDRVVVVAETKTSISSGVGIVVPWV